MWKTLSQPSETLSLDQFHTQQYDPHRVLQSITGKWIGLDGKCFGSLAVIFSAEGLPIYVAFYEESKFINGHYQAVEPRPDSTTAIPELGILISAIQGYLYSAPLAVRLPSRTASFRPEANSAALRRGEGGASPDVSSAKRRNISSSSEISPAVKLTPPPDSPSTPASLSELRRMVRDDHGVSWTDYEVRKLFTLNHI